MAIDKTQLFSFKSASNPIATNKAAKPANQEAWFGVNTKKELANDYDLGEKGSNFLRNLYA